ncbi:MAG: thiamine pyrophosphate-dependent enzyme [Oscillospiraceae bacterium]|nr:thiamine pyrophosphate-dependent enzyme [Oscillospiraceae bacterium]
MNDTKLFIDELKEYGFEKFAGVPCSFLGSIINEVENRGLYEAFVNEGDALAYAAGASLGGNKCAVLMQNSGLSNALSPLTSLNELFGLHTLLIIGNRGVDDEPQHRIMATVVKPFLDALNIPYFNAEDEDCLKNANACLAQSSAAILVNEKTTFSSVKLNSVVTETNEFPLRYDVLKAISSGAGDSVIVTATGFTSREMYCIKDRAENFYMVGSMGCLSSLALGLSENLPNKTIIAIDGDSACLMRLGGLYTLTQKKPDNLCYIVLDNSANESTGGQRNSFGESRVFDVMERLYPTAYVNSPDELAGLIKAFRATPRYTQMYSRIRVGTMKDLPRPERDLIFGQATRFKEGLKTV